MRKSTCITLIKAMLMEIRDGRGSREWKNPESVFHLNEGNGRYEKLNDSDYGIIRRDTEKVSDLSQDESGIPVSDLFIRFLESLDMDDKCIADIAGLLSACYKKSSGSFLPELDHPEHMTNKPNIRQPAKQYPKDSRPRKKPLPDDTHNVDLKDPKQIYGYLTTYIHGQKDACRAASMLLYNHLQGQRRNVLFVGPTGCGKTEIWKVCKRLYPNIVIVDSDRLTADGWSGAFKIRDIFTNMMKFEIERSIVVFDEFDKLCEPTYSSQGANYSYNVQNNLLKLIEGESMMFPAERGNSSIMFDSSKISFVFLGSFERLTEKKSAIEADNSIGFGSSIEKPDADTVYAHQITLDDLKYSGMRREIAGRINQIVQLSPMTMKDYEAILENDAVSPIHRLEQEYDITIHIPEGTRKRLAREAADTHMGVRYLQSRIQSMLDEHMFEDCGKSEYVLDMGDSTEKLSYLQ